MGIFDYDKTADLKLYTIGERAENGIIDRLFRYEVHGGIRRIGNLYRPEKSTQPLPVILYVHWYEPHDITSNRSQFIEEAKELAQAGAICLLIETQWSDIDYFQKRDHEDDIPNTVQQVIELRQAMDILLSQPEVDASRFAYVGHDFGAMTGVLAGSIDGRPTAYVLMAGTPRFSEWYLYRPRLEGEERDQFIASFVDYDPITHIRNLAPASLFFQLGKDDFHVPVARGEEFYYQASNPKQVRWYDAGHKLNEQATSDRIHWLKDTLSL